jgi:two-component system, LuxR family, response regulator FixJ
MRDVAELIPAMSGPGDERGAAMSPQSRSVAVVDDDEAVCDSTRFLLETYGFAVRTYLSGTAFLEDNPEVECIVVDYHMPDLNGFELASQLRARGSHVPVIMITATAEPTAERRAAELGIKRILRKPLSNRALLNAVREELE